MERRYTYNVMLGVYDDTSYAVWNWDQANALAVIGKGGSGKTTAAAYYLGQLAGQGVSIIMCDPHMDNRQSLYVYTDFLRGALIKPCVKSYDTITEYVMLVHDLGNRRINNEAEHFPLVLVIDEFTSFVINSDSAKQASIKLLDSVNQYRKVNIRVILIGQTWGNALRMVSGLRDAISDSVVLKSSANDARKFCAFEATAKEANLLDPGVGYYQDEKIWIPRVTGTGKLTVKNRAEKFTYGSVENNAPQIFNNEVLLNHYL